MKLEDFKDTTSPKYIESCDKIIEYGNCKNVQFCTECPFYWHNQEYADCTEYSNSTDCLIKDERLVESAKKFKELVEMNKGITYEQYMKKIENVDFSSELVSVEDIKSISNKDEEYIILDQNESICSEINSIKLAEEFVNNSLQKDSSNTFTIYKKVKTGKAKVNVETEWEE